MSVKTRKWFKLKEPNRRIFKGLSFEYENKKGETVTIDFTDNESFEIYVTVGLTDDEIKKIETVMPLSEITE